jgi:hypothetical protein
MGLPPRRRERRGNPQYGVGDGVFARKTKNTVSGLCGLLVFWYFGLAPLKTRFLWPWGCVFGTWHVAVWIL